MKEENMIEKLGIKEENGQWIVTYNRKRCAWISKSGYESRKEAEKVIKMIVSCSRRT